MPHDMKPLCLTGWTVRRVHEAPGSPAGVQQRGLQDRHEQGRHRVLQEQSDHHGHFEADADGHEEPGNSSSPTPAL